MSTGCQEAPYLYLNQNGDDPRVGDAICLYSRNTAELSFQLSWDATWPATVIVEVTNDPQVHTDPLTAKWEDVTERFIFVQPVDAPAGAGGTLIAADGLSVGWIRLRITGGAGEIVYNVWVCQTPRQ